MKNILITITVTLLLTACKSERTEDINLSFTYISSVDSDDSKQPLNFDSEISNTRKTDKGIEITVEKYVTGIPYYGKARISNDTLYLDYWTNIDEMNIPSVIVPKIFKYEIVDVSYKAIKFNFLGNKFHRVKSRQSR